MYHSGNHLDAWSVGLAMAEMPWSIQYFRDLKNQNQCRIEQGGRLSGTVMVDGEAEDLDLVGIRDHSWGRRDWAFISRYVWILITLEKPVTLNSESFQYLCFTSVRYGTFSRLVSGWISGSNVVRPLVFGTGVKDIAEDGIIPETFDVDCQARGLEPVRLHFKRKNANAVSWMMNKNRFEVNEAFVDVSFQSSSSGVVGGIGMAEFGYNLEQYPR
eukprot:CAMPEP_0119134508 /NCGR_PEP_ID=MMETSP1310-20130426/17072_1 /TAXON_ID=464262 /ORGANISM="Genus nov. species nov., Strain RCC2339" /LENGTH=214 /DNA_ID=CAMNT_0007125307 /DNA_START=8 /DNA_END=652 /DNA_ORIENTATION=+